MLCDIIIDKGDGERDRIFTDMDLSVWNIRQWFGLYSVFSQCVKENGYAKIIITPNNSF